MQVETDAVLPHSLEAEMCALGSMLITESACYDVIALINHEDFYSPAHSKIFESIQHLATTSRAVDIVTVKNELLARDQLHLVGGAEYLIQIADSVPSASNAAHYAALVRDYAVQRRLILAAGEIPAIVRDGYKALDLKIAETLGIIHDAASMRTTKEFTSAREMAFEIEDRLEQSSSTGETFAGQRTLLSALDRRLRPMKDGQLIVIAARPAMGKTALCLKLISNLCASGVPTAFFSLEMTAPEITDRIVASLANVTTDTIRKAPLADADYDAILKATGEFGVFPLLLDDSTGLTVSDVKAALLRMERTKGRRRAVVIDHLQLMRSPRRAENRNLEMGEITRDLKALAKDLSVPIILLCQLSRSVENRDNKRPRLSDLLDSGSIEANADVVMGLYRPSYYDAKEKDNDLPDAWEEFEILLLKQRDGGLGTVKIGFHPPTQRFSYLSDKEE